MTRRLAGALLTAAALALGACGAGDKAGGSGDEVTLRVVTDDGPERPVARAIEEFARQVRRLSDGRIRIKPAYEAAGDVDDWDQRVARLVTSGQAEAGLVPSRAWDTEGVTTLRPLSAPFLLTTEDQVNEVVTGELATELLAGLRRVGVVGLALVPESLRHPFGIEKALLTPADFEGATIRTPRSDTTEAMIRALGASPTDAEGVEVQRMISAGGITGVETSFELAEPLTPAIATGNVTLFPKVNALVVNADIWEDLSDEQRSQLQEAARRTRDWAIERNVPDAQAARTYCASGGRVTLARPAQIAALEEVTRPVYDELDEDADTARLIRRIRAAIAAFPAEEADIPKACGPTEGEAEEAPAPGSGATRTLVGVYRFKVSLKELVERGMDEERARADHGLNTVTLRADGSFHIETLQKEDLLLCDGSWKATATRLTLTMDGVHCNGELTATWKLDGRSLHLSDFHDPPAEQLFAAKPLRKIR